MKTGVVILLVFSLFYSCGKEEIKVKQAEALPSFSNEPWEFTDVTFEGADADYVDIKLYHNNDTNGLTDHILLSTIPTIEDSIPLSFRAEGTQHSTISTSYYYILIDEDALGENYVIDSTKQSYIILDCITKNRITGSFTLNYVISSTSLLPKFAPYIPDTFSIRQGRFNAKRL